jgi:CLIP-associating protein 1/2
MGEKVTDEQVADCLALLRTDASVDIKVNVINNVKSAIKQNNVPETTIPFLFEITQISMGSQHASLVNAGFTTLGHLLTRLSRQEPRHLVKQAARTLPLLLDKIGDQKDKFRTLAAQCFTTIWKVAPMDVERAVRNVAMTGKNSRAKEASLVWLVKVIGFHTPLGAHYISDNVHT